MAEEQYVRMDVFSEFVKRMEDRFDHVEKAFVHVNELAAQRYDLINQRFADAEKAREQNYVHLNQRLDDMNQRFNDMSQGMNQRFDSLEKRFDDQRRIILVMLSAIVAAAVGVMVKVFFFSS